MTNCWLLRPNPHKGRRMEEFLNEEVGAIGWPELPNLEGKTKEEICQLVQEAYTHYSPSQAGAAIATINKFVNEMWPGDIIVVPDDSDIYFAEITGNYRYNAGKSSDQEGYPHQRPVKWLKGPVRRDDIPSGLRESLRAPRTLANLNHHTREIRAYLGLDGQTSSTMPVSPGMPISQISGIKDADDCGYISHEYMLRLNRCACVRIPTDITKAEAARLADFVRTLYFSGE